MILWGGHYNHHFRNKGTDVKRSKQHGGFIVDNSISFLNASYPSLKKQWKVQSSIERSESENLMVNFILNVL